MKTKKWLMVVAAVSMTPAPAVFAQTRTFRSPAAFVGVSQGEVANKPAYNIVPLIGADLVNLALGTAPGTPRTNEVLALGFDCAGTNVDLVVFDRTSSNNIATIASSSSFDTVEQAKKKKVISDGERFVAMLNVASLGNSTNGLLGGYLTLAGRIYIGTNGCPQAIRVDTDRRSDKECGDPTAVKDNEGDGRPKAFAGRAHFIGVLDVLSDGSTNTVLVPTGALSINRQLSP